MVLVLLGILSAYVAPRFIDRDSFSELTARQEIKQAIRYAQQVAMSRTNDAVTFSSNANAIDVKINDNSVGNGYRRTPANVTIDNIVLTFNSLGALLGATADARIGIVGNSQPQPLHVCVVATTGYAYDCP